ncbi:hypothetical protein FF38_02477 [Lucilia cuprina]|uniref:Uncharacterized protein n=1 Tax=Lucilia cuprina TaxID=7375 RepID=A0A0L0BV89_LUCCU|nr:hypothetical protein CVS40_7950 [Lucilia cuprina]KAI8120895.1 hypothetical protein CVS40_7950 [Lucilia cuprina]KNC23159.1 hypothetical protein FF38_02477 [Lucilia cuprina]
MDWLRNLLLLLVLMPFVYSWSPIPSSRSRSFYAASQQQQQQQKQLLQHKQQQTAAASSQRSAVSPYFDLILCPIREQPWSCARQQSARLLDIWDGELHVQWQKLKAEADRQLNSTLERRGYSDSTTLSKEKPSTILKKIEIGTNYMKEYLAETMDGFLGREYEYLQNTKNNYQTQNDEENEEHTDEYEETDDDEDEEEDDEQDNTGNANEQTGDLKNTNNGAENANNLSQAADSDAEFFEIEEGTDNNEDNEQETDDAVEELKKPGGGNKRRKKKKKKGSQHDIGTQAANLLVIQPLEHQLASHQHHDDSFDAHGATQLIQPVVQKIKPLKQKKRKKKKGQHGGGHGGATATYVVEQEPATDHLGLGLLEELADWDVDDGFGGKRKKKHSMKYGRSNGVTRGKKKKKKKALMKLMLLGSFLKAKIELLLKLLGAHLQIKFFAIALIGLLINIARFWIDVKRGGTPQKVVYVEHAHHQHHYEDHGDDWSESAGGGGGGYWKRSLQTDSTENTYDSVTDSYQPRPQQVQQLLQQQSQQYDPQYLAYRNQWQRK